MRVVTIDDLTVLAMYWHLIYFLIIFVLSHLGVWSQCGHQGLNSGGCNSTTITTVCGQLCSVVTIGFTTQLWSCEKHNTTFKIRTRVCFFYETDSHNDFANENSCSYLNDGGYVAPPWWQSWFSVFINLILGYGHIGHNVVAIESPTQLWWFCCNTCLHAGL